MVKAVIFDLDGLMVDSEPIQSLAFQDILNDLDIKPDLQENGLIQIVGLTEWHNWQILKDKYAIKFDIDELVTRRQPAYLKRVQNDLQLMPSLLKLLKGLKTRDIKIGLASSSKYPVVQSILEKFVLTDYFSVIMAGDQVKSPKPHPEIYLSVAKQLECAPENCLALEDSETGIKAAHAAGMQVVAIPNLYTAAHDFSKAHHICNTLEDIIALDYFQ